MHQFPELCGVIARGEIHLTGLLMIALCLGGERHAEVIERARFRSKREISRLMAEFDPKPGVPPRIEAVAPALPRARTLAEGTRDGSQCAYVDERGRRCAETRGLEVHHREAHGFGGPATVENLELRCRSHNVLAAEQDFGRQYMDWVRGMDGASPNAREPTL